MHRAAEIFGVFGVIIFGQDYAAQLALGGVVGYLKALTVPGIGEKKIFSVLFGAQPRKPTASEQVRICGAVALLGVSRIEHERVVAAVGERCLSAVRGLHFRYGVQPVAVFGAAERAESRRGNDERSALGAAVLYKLAESRTRLFERAVGCRCNDDAPPCRRHGAVAVFKVFVCLARFWEIRASDEYHGAVGTFVGGLLRIRQAEGQGARQLSYAVLQLLCARRRSLVSRGIYQGDAGKIDVGGRRRLGHGVRAYHAVARWRTRCKRGQRTEHRAYHKTFYNRVFHFRCSLFRIRPGLRSMPQQDRM